MYDRCRASKNDDHFRFSGKQGRQRRKRLDTLVVFDKIKNQKEICVLVKKQFRNFLLPSNVFVMDISEFNHGKDDKFSFTHEIVTTGTVVYGS